MNKARFLLKDKNKDKTSIRMEYRFYGKRVVYGTGLLVKSRYWNNRTQRVKTSVDYPEYVSINKELEKIDRAVKDILTHFQDQIGIPTKNQFLNKLKEVRLGVSTLEAPTILEFIATLIRNKKASGVKKSGYSHILKIQSMFKRYSGVQEFSFEEVDVAFIDRFKAYLFNRNYEQNYVRDVLKRFKFILKTAFDEGIHTNTSFNYKDFLPASKVTDSARLDLDELRQLEAFDFSKYPKLDRARDLFLIDCDLGVRYNVLKDLSLADIQEKNGLSYIQVFTNKTDKEVHIPISSRVKRILEKYHGFPRVISNQKLNDYVKEVCRLAGINKPFRKRIYKGGRKSAINGPKWKFIGTHTARRSFATNAIFSGIDSRRVMLITGHSTEKEFNKYIGIDTLANALELANHEMFNQ